MKKMVVRNLYSKGENAVLSKTSIVICGMLLEGEMNAYDMLKMIDRMYMKYWHPIGATTLYETCIRPFTRGLYSKGNPRGPDKGTATG